MPINAAVVQQQRTRPNALEKAPRKQGTSPRQLAQCCELAVAEALPSGAAAAAVAEAERQPPQQATIRDSKASPSEDFKAAATADGKHATEVVPIDAAADQVLKAGSGADAVGYPPRFRVATADSDARHPPPPACGQFAGVAAKSGEAVETVRGSTLETSTATSDSEATLSSASAASSVCTADSTPSVLIREIAAGDTVLSATCLTHRHHVGPSPSGVSDGGCESFVNAPSRPAVQTTTESRAANFGATRATDGDGHRESSPCEYLLQANAAESAEPCRATEDRASRTCLP